MDYILFIDDERICHKMIELLMSRSNQYRVITAFTGKEALEKFEKNANKIVLVLCDLMLPDVTGYDVYNAIVKHHNKHIPFILQTAITNSKHIVSKSSEKNISILHKPYTKDELMQKIKFLLNP